MAVTPRVEIDADMTVDEVKVLFALEGVDPPYLMRNAMTGREFRYDTMEALLEDFQRHVWWGT